jgi:8-oxo-dGTP pyrophosphatase MutT (NUDIX family)
VWARVSNRESNLDRIPDAVARFAKALPRLPDGRIDYSGASEAAVLDCYVFCRDRILLLKRRRPLAGIEHAWHVVSGFLDEECSLRKKVEAELLEETGIRDVVDMQALQPYRHADATIWNVYPVRVQVASQGPILLNEEHSEYAWFTIEDMDRLLLPHACAALRRN